MRLLIILFLGVSPIFLEFVSARAAPRAATDVLREQLSHLQQVIDSGNIAQLSRIVHLGSHANEQMFLNIYRNVQMHVLSARYTSSQNIDATVQISIHGEAGTVAHVRLHKTRYSLAGWFFDVFQSNGHK
ncbi:unnamed protein product [Caenorhabditis sp. 36 PRJEB53466]|nr:unnamed protein product [Caenorhabditis sp. 36 PRJEB53466]